MNPESIGSNSETPLPPPGSLYDAPRKSNLWIASIVIILVLLGVGGVGAYIYIKNTQSPKNIIRKVFLSLQNTTSLSYTGKLEGKLTIPQDPNFDIGIIHYSVSSDGKVDYKNKTPILDMSFDAAVKASNAQGKLDISASGEFIGKDAKGYVQFNTINLAYKPTSQDPTMTAVLQYFQTALQGITKQWIVFDTSVSTTSQKKEPRNPEKFADIFERIETLEDETINGVLSHHFRVHLNKEKLQEELRTYQTMTSQSKPLGVLFGAVAKSQPIFSGESEDTTTIDFWIGKKDYYIYKVAFSELKVADEEKDTIFTLMGEVELNDYDVPVSVTIPSKTLTPEQISKQVLGPMLGGGR